MKTRSLILLLSSVLVSGCEQLFPEPPNEPTGPVTLKAFSSEEEFKDYVRDEIAARNSAMADAYMTINRGDAVSALPESTGANGAPAPSAGDADLGADSGYSQTTIQEFGVDEADVIKTDGEFLYIIDDTTAEGSTLRIVRAYPADQLALLSETPLDGYGREIYLHDGKVVAVTATYGGLFFIGVPDVVALEVDAAGSGGSGSGRAEAVDASESTPAAGAGGASDSDSAIDVALPPTDLVPPYRFERPRVTATVIDVSDPATPRILSTTKFDGSPASSRMIGGTLHMVLANYQNYYFDVMPRLGAEEFDASAVDVDSLLPRYEQTDASGIVTVGDLVTWQDVYRPDEPDGFGIVTVVSLDSGNAAALRATGVVAEPGLIYSSPNALYLTNTSYDYLGNMRSTTKVYKLNYAEGRALPSSAGSIPGRVLNQYSMSEHNGVLRVASTVDPVFTLEGELASATNSVYCLGDSSGELKVVGSVDLKGIRPGETIQSARFIGDRGFVVTFEQRDPLHTLDLTDPANPREVGLLEVPGFSTYMVPLDADHLLAVGQYVSEDGFGAGGVQLSVYDVSDFARPLLKHNVVLGGDGGAWSEALYDPKAFTYFARQGLLALPVNIYPRYEFEEFIDDDVKPVASDTDGGDVSTSDSVVDSEPPPDTIAVGEPTVISEGFEGLFVYRVSTESGFTELGRIDTRWIDPAYYSWNSFTRGVFINDLVYAVTNLGVRAAAVTEVGTVTQELFYGVRYPIEPLPLPSEPLILDVEPDGSAEPESEVAVDPAPADSPAGFGIGGFAGGGTASPKK